MSRFILSFLSRGVFCACSTTPRLGVPSGVDVKCVLFWQAGKSTGQNHVDGKFVIVSFFIFCSVISRLLK